MIQVDFHRIFKKQFKKLPIEIKEAFFQRLRIFKQEPTTIILNNHDVSAAYPGCRSFNVTGDFRAIFTINEGVAVIIRIGTHSELYG